MLCMLPSLIACTWTSATASFTTPDCGQHIALLFLLYLPICAIPARLDGDMGSDEDAGSTSLKAYYDLLRDNRAFTIVWIGEVSRAPRQKDKPDSHCPNLQSEPAKPCISVWPPADNRQRGKLAELCSDAQSCGKFSRGQGIVDQRCAYCPILAIFSAFPSCWCCSRQVYSCTSVKGIGFLCTSLQHTLGT